MMGNDKINTKKEIDKETKKNNIQNIHEKGCKEGQVYVFQERVLKEDKIERNKGREYEEDIFWQLFTFKWYNDIG